MKGHMYEISFASYLNHQDGSLINWIRICSLHSQIDIIRYRVNYNREYDNGNHDILDSKFHIRQRKHSTSPLSSRDDGVEFIHC
jgi:hypothetical protein